MAAWKRDQPGRAGAAGDVRDRRQRGHVAVDHGRRRGRAAVPGHPGGVRLDRDRRRRPVPHAVLVDAARDRLFLALPRLHRVLHDGPARGRRAALLRHDGPAHLHPVPALFAAGRHAPPVHGPRALERVQVPADGADGARRRPDAADRVHDHRLDGDRRADARRQRAARLGQGAAVGQPDGARDRSRLLHAVLRRRRRADQHELRHERDDPQHQLGHRALPPDLRRHRGDHVLRDRLRDLADPDRPRVPLAAGRCGCSCGCGSSA